MADYRRFISYMYLYEHGRKAGNSGFVRVECRNGECRLSVHMTGLYDADPDGYAVYMLVSQPGCYRGIDIGRMDAKQMSGDMELVLDADDLMGTGISLSEISGMAVLGSGSLHGTRWDDEPLETGCFEKQQSEGKGVILFGTKAAPAVAPDENAVVQQAEAEMAERAVARESEERMQATSVVRQSEADMTENSMAPRANGDVPEASVLQETSEVRKTARDASAHPDNIYEKILHQYPQMYPFDDDSVEACVKLELQDLGLLPMQCWSYGSNSFLLHGYYCYRHLLLARVADGQYILGVPGVMQHREEYMAALFGFSSFKPVSQANKERGAFGYWTTSIL